MKKLTWDREAYRIDGEPVFLVSGEFHYFRVPRADWETRLRLFKEAGGNCVATYVPWGLHEPAEGDLCFGDVPERDLTGFLEACLREELYVICRPGPYQYSELRYDGLPGWLCDYYPEILARDVHGGVMRGSSVSYLHPTFLQKARKWYEAVCPLLAPYTVENGGPIAFAQFDNELIGIHEWFGGWDYNTDTMGFGREDGRYARFLKQRYGDLRALNRCYGTAFPSFGSVTPLPGDPEASDEDRVRAKDYQEFYFAGVAEYAQTLMNWFEELGVHCNYMHNAANPGMNAYFREAVEKTGGSFLLGSDHYYNLNMDWAQNNPTPQYASKVFTSNELLRLMGFPPTVCELPGGSASEWPPITPVDLSCCYLLNTAFGMKGSNYYIFTGGPNPANLGADGDSYDYNASVGAGGQIRPAYQAQKAFGQFLRDNEWMAAAHRVSDFYLGLTWEQSRGEHYYQKGDERGPGAFEAWEFQRKGMLISALCASRAPEYLDLEGELRPDGKPLFVTTSGCMRRRVQENLVRYVEAGGRLLLAPVIPLLDEDFTPCTVLSDFLEGAQARPLRAAFPRASVGEIRNVQAQRLWKSAGRPADAVSIGVEETTGGEIAWRKEYPGGGCVLWLGIQWSHAKNSHLELLRYLTDGDPAVRCGNPNLWTSLVTDGERRMLFLINLFTSELEAQVQVRRVDGSYQDLGRCTVPAMTVLPLRV